jgi:DNA-binding NarL/FixJ family response regulator
MNLKSGFSRDALSQNQPSTVADGVEGLYNTMKALEARLGPSGVLFAAWNPSVFTLANGVVFVEQIANLRRSNLTPREREVVKLIAEGNSARKIASALGLSVKTVDAHRFNLMRKLDIHNKAQLVTYAIQKKIVNVPAEA